ncbi:HET domain-containing protein [Fusarium falciforme]|uniref:HET domain-containing protein n=1 Tax=Fusarium falciforme TaxID=195108 RepID=UPI002300F80D|nr:HET domain-containing protein [Fusarium falciforme]WAO89022.1 HET domain-containing protein [Fusarium falciforme]
MSYRAWKQVERTFERLTQGKNSIEEDHPAHGTLPDRTRNELISEPYEYAALAGGPGSIRLLQLLPGTRQDDIACNLVEYSLDSRLQEYDALSYVWGDKTNLTPIQINERTLMVTTNLRTALFNIRKPDQPCTLWVDAVCIDQNSVLERNHQVSIMADIYRNAARTIVWMGDSRPAYTAKAFAMVDELAAEAISRQHPSMDIDPYNPTLAMLQLKLTESPLFDRFRDDFSILHLACAEWWFRAWTVQEILLASHAVIMAGTFTMDWERFSAGINYGFALGIWNPVTLGIIVDPIVIPYLSTHALWEQRQRPSTTTPEQTLLELLVQCRFRQASDPRDKVYALLGLIDADADNSAGSFAIEADYRLSTSQVYCHATRQLLLQLGNLNVLGACTPTTNLELPSWVPDWSAPSGPRPLMHDARGKLRQTHASCGTKATPRFTDDRLLVLAGHEVMTITYVSPVLHRLQRDGSGFKPIKAGDTLMARLASLGQLFMLVMAIYWELSSVVPHLATFWDWEAFAQKSSVSSKSSQDTPSTDPGFEDGYDPLAVYWQTLCVGTFTSGGRHATAQLFYSWRSSLRPVFHLHQWRVDSLFRPLAFLGYVMRTWRDYSEFASLLEPVYERRLGRGENGFLALLPGDAEVGDRIVLVKGGRVPLLLRRDGEGQYRLVGEAYVHGIMDGEMFEEAKCVEMKMR